MEKIYLAGGCFWGLEKFLNLIEGVEATTVGFANGDEDTAPTYKQVCTDTTGFVEAVEVVYNPTKISLKFLLETFFKAIDPTSLNRQGEDTGTQYRTGIYYINNRDKEIIQQELIELQNEYDKKIVVENLPLKNYYLAEDYHQKYLVKNPDGYCHIDNSIYELAKNAKETK